MFVADLTRLGYLPLQHFEKDCPLELRSVAYATRVFGHEDSGHFITEDSDGRLTEGDIANATLWFPSKAQGAKTRSIPAWSFAMPAVTKGKAFKDPHDKVVSVTAVPVHDRGWGADDRFEGLEAWLPPDLEDLPDGTGGVVIGATEESEQIPLFLPMSRNALVAANRGDASKGSTVYDVDGAGKLSDVYKVKLQSMMRVVRPTDAAPDVTALAWQMTYSTGGDSLHGFGIMYGDADDTLVAAGDGSERQPDPKDGTRVATEDPTDTMARVRGSAATTTPSGDMSTVNRDPASSTGGINGQGQTPADAVRDKGEPAGAAISYAAQKQGGPFSMGGKHDKHRICMSADGEPVNAGHLSTKALWYGHGGDAPLDFEQAAYTQPPSAPGRSKVHLRFDANTGHKWGDGRAGTGLWRWECETVVVPPPPIGDPRKPPPPGDDPHPPPIQHFPPPPPPSGSCNRVNDGQMPSGGPSMGATTNGAPTANGVQSGLSGSSAGTVTRGPTGQITATQTRHPAGHPGPAVAAGTDTGTLIRERQQIADGGGPEVSVLDQITDTNGRPFRNQQPSISILTQISEFDGAGRPTRPDTNVIQQLDGANQRFQQSTTRTFGTPVPPAPSQPAADKRIESKPEPTQQPTSPSTRHQRHGTSLMGVAIDTMLMQPRSSQKGAQDTGQSSVLKKTQILKMQQAPLVGRLVMWGQQSGGDWIKNTKVGGRSAGGTATGGMLMLSPEVDLIDSDTNFAPAQVVKSETGFTSGPGTHMSQGSVDLARGEVVLGFKETLNTAGTAQKKVYKDSTGTVGAGTKQSSDGRLAVVNSSETELSALTPEGTVSTTDLGGTPATPASGHGDFYFKGGIPYGIADDGTEYDLTTGSGGGVASLYGGDGRLGAVTYSTATNTDAQGRMNYAGLTLEGTATLGAVAARVLWVLSTGPIDVQSTAKISATGRGQVGSNGGASGSGKSGAVGTAGSAGINGGTAYTAFPALTSGGGGGAGGGGGGISSGGTGGAGGNGGVAVNGTDGSTGAVWPCGGEFTTGTEVAASLFSGGAGGTNVAGTAGGGGTTTVAAPTTALNATIRDMLTDNIHTWDDLVARFPLGGAGGAGGGGGGGGQTAGSHTEPGGATASAGSQTGAGFGAGGNGASGGVVGAAGGAGSGGASGAGGGGLVVECLSTITLAAGAEISADGGAGGGGGGGGGPAGVAAGGGGGGGGGGGSGGALMVTSIGAQTNVDSTHVHANGGLGGAGGSKGDTVDSDGGAGGAGSKGSAGFCFYAQMVAA